MTTAKYLAASALLALATLVSPVSAKTPDPEQDLKEMTQTAADVAEDAFRLQANLRDYSIHSDAYRLELDNLRDSINTLGRTAVQLDNERAQLQPWEQKALDKVLPLLEDAATQTRNAIAFYNENRLHLWSPGFQAMTQKIYQDASRIDHTLKAYIKYEHAVQQERQLESAVEAGGF